MSPLKRSLIELLIGIPVVFGVSALLDFLYQTIITQNTYRFNFSICAYCICIWIILEIVLYLTRRKKQNKEK